MKSAAIWVFGPMTLFISVQYLRICAYPVVSDNSIAIKWLFFPFIRVSFDSVCTINAPTPLFLPLRGVRGAARLSYVRCISGRSHRGF